MYQCVLDNRIGSAQSAARLSIQLGKNVLFFEQHLRFTLRVIYPFMIYENRQVVGKSITQHIRINVGA